MELFHLRLLLLNRPGMKGWDDVLTVEGVQYGTFREACDALGIASGEASVSYADSIADVVTHGSGWQIRRFFAILVVHCLLGDVTDVWLQHRDKMAEDFRRRGFGVNRALICARNEVIDNIVSHSDDVSCRERMLGLLPLPPECDQGELSLKNYWSQTHLVANSRGRRVT